MHAMRPGVAFLTDWNHAEVAGAAPRRPAFEDVMQMRERGAADAATRLLTIGGHALKVSLAGCTHSR